MSQADFVSRLGSEAVLARIGASNPAVFGSVARGDDGHGSDVDLLVDLLVDLPSDVGLFGLGELESALSELLGADVDVTWCRVDWCAMTLSR